MGAELRLQRRSVRLRHVDYAQAAACFVTVCTEGRKPRFGHVVDGAMRLNEWGRIAADEWARTADLRPNVELDAFVVMPNHVHGIWMIVDDAGSGTMHRAPTPNSDAPAGTMHRVPTDPMRQFGQPVAGSLPTLVGMYKAAVSRRIHRLPGADGITLWQRNYYEHIIRSTDDWQRIRQYIAGNPARWAADSLFVVPTKDTP